MTWCQNLLDINFQAKNIIIQFLEINLDVKNSFGVEWVEDWSAAMTAR